MWAGLRFTVPRLKDTYKTVQFDLQIRRYNSVWSYTRDTSPIQTYRRHLIGVFLFFLSKNENNSHSEVASYKLEIVVQADVILQG